MISRLLESPVLAPSLVSFGIAICLHIIARRRFRKATTRTLLSWSLSTGGILCASWALLSYAGGLYCHATDVFAPLILYGGLAYSLADGYGFHRGAIRLQALRAIHQHGGTASVEALRQHCGIEATLDRRLAQYLDRGEIVLNNGRYVLVRRRILVITRLFQAARRLVLGTHPGSV